MDVRITRRTLQVVLGLVWLLDGALQFQPFMLGTGFARQVIAPGGAGQPDFVAIPVRWAAHMVAANPVAWDVPFALTQVLIGVGLLVPRTARLALAASIPWALAVWFLGEGLSGLAGGNASLRTGAPGAALLYAVLALAAWQRRDASIEAPASWLPLAWAVLWVGAAVLDAIPGRSADAPVVVAEALIGLAALHSRTRIVGVAAGFAAALTIWAVAQDFGQLTSGRATDPNTAPIIALMAVAVLGSRRTRLFTSPARASLGIGAPVHRPVVAARARREAPR
jgi:hypothetical protein